MKKRVLLLQGPVGSFFKYLSKHLRGAGFDVKRLIFNGGDLLFALGGDFDVVRVDEDGHSAFFEQLFLTWRPDVILLLGDERPIHRAARAAAGRAAIPVWCFEEGYIRPDHITLELGGNNANSSLRDDFDPQRVFPPLPPAPRLSGQTVAMGLRAWAYFVAHRSTRHLFPGYVHHRERRLRDEVRFWTRSFYRRAMATPRDSVLVKRLIGGHHPRFFIVALQVHDDMQLRVHGRGWRNMTFAEMVLESFRRAAPPDATLVIKAHPLDVGHGHNRKNIALSIEKYGLGDRVWYLQTGPMLPIVRHAQGLVTINSTAGIAALRNDIPVLAFGDALYHIDGLTKRPEGPEDLDRFWSAPPKVDPLRARRFGDFVMNTVLLPGSFYLKKTWPALCDLIVERIRPVAAPETSAEAVTAAGEPAATLPPLTAAPVVAAAASGGGAPGARRLRAGISSGGIWRHRDIVARLLDAEPVRFRIVPADDCDVLVGWGHKPTARRVRRHADRRGLPYIALEDGFLRSVRPGGNETPIGWIVDHSGIYYDSHQPSDLETAIRRRGEKILPDRDRAIAAMEMLRRLQLSKYNHAPMSSAAALDLPFGRDVVLVIDQTFDDASIAGAGADSADFAKMLNAAIDENPGLPVVVKTHPEAISGAKRGYIQELARRRGITLLTRDVNPWVLIGMARRVYVVSSQFGFEALLAGVPVTCFGASFYAGWGLTDDRFAPVRRRDVVVDRENLAAAAYFDYCRWIDPYHGTEIDFESAVDRLAFLRDRFHENTASVCVGFSRWKRRAAAKFLVGIGGEPAFAADEAEAVRIAHRNRARIVVWGNRAFRHGADAQPDVHPDVHPDVPMVRAEDGFLRSVGLGAAFVRPVSLVFDGEGIYYDPRRPSRFETLAERTAFDAATVARAASLRERLVAQGLSKYNDGVDDCPVGSAGKLRILVPGQVEDDASVRLGSPEVRTNLELLQRVRARWPEAHVIYKPHPDVQAGFRRGRIPDDVAAGLADQVVIDVSMPALLSRVDRVETMTSLTGFEALLRGVAVAVHGIPFYAGWGLTEDLVPCPRRTRRLTLDELVAVTLILYPRYVDPKTDLACPPEIIVERLIEMRARSRTLTGRMLGSLRNANAWVAHNLLGPVWTAVAAGLRDRGVPR